MIEVQRIRRVLNTRVYACDSDPLAKGFSGGNDKTIERRFS